MLVLVAFTAMLGLGQTPWTGRVSSSDGEPLAGVRVCSTFWSCSLTDREGRFSHDPTLAGFAAGHRSSRIQTVAHFSLEGFRPVTRLVTGSGDKLEVTLRPAEDAVWRAPNCKEPPNWRNWIGGRLRVTITKGARMVRSDDADYSSGLFWYSKTEALHIGGGPSWSSGIPPSGLLEGSTVVSERMLAFPDGMNRDPNAMMGGVDVRGVHANGNRWRFTGHAFQTFSYEQASPQAAAYFDGIIDTLCWLPVAQ